MSPDEDYDNTNGQYINSSDVKTDINRAPIGFGKYRTDQLVLLISSLFLIKFTETEVSVFIPIGFGISVFGISFINYETEIPKSPIGTIRFGKLPNSISNCGFISSYDLPN